MRRAVQLRLTSLLQQAALLKPRAALRPAASYLRDNWGELLIILSLILLSLWVRRLTLQSIEGGGDAVRKWFFIKQWSYAGSFRELSWDHHMTRFGINVWAYLVQKLWGTGPSSYYLAPMGAATAAVVSCYLLARSLAGRFAGLLAATWLVILEPFVRAGSQLLPGAFSAAYIALAAFLLVCFSRSNSPWRRVWLVLSAGALFFAYLSTIANTLFVPGFLLAVFLARKSFRELGWFAGTLLALWLLESAWYVAFTEHSTRFDVVTQSHGGGTIKGVARRAGRAARGAAASHVFGLNWERMLEKLFERYSKLDSQQWFAVVTSLASGAGLIAFSKKRQSGHLALLVLVYLFCFTFSIRSLKPFKVWASNEPRYFIVLMPLLLSMNAAFFVEAMKQVKSRAPRLLFLPWRNRFAPGWAVLVCLAVGYGYYDKRAARDLSSGRPMSYFEHKGRMLSDAYARGLPIIEKRTRGQKSLRLAYSVLLDERLLVRGDVLPSFEVSKATLSRSLSWLSKDPPAYLVDATLKYSRERSCVYVLSLRGRFVRFRPNRRLPKRCVAKAARGL